MRLRELNPGYPSLLCVLRHLQSHGLEAASYAGDPWLSASCAGLYLAQHNEYFSVFMVFDLPDPPLWYHTRLPLVPTSLSGPLLTLLYLGVVFPVFRLLLLSNCTLSTADHI